MRVEEGRSELEDFSFKKIQKKETPFWPASVRIGLLIRYVRDPFVPARSDRYASQRDDTASRFSRDTFGAACCFIWEDSGSSPNFSFRQLWCRWDLSGMICVDACGIVAGSRLESAPWGT